ncbi:questin oxidase family protein [Vibrio sp. Of7-15]|uniref:questin oxidase family protein n=1 Tax=Vibrio sp. Of7-15 TaxID=2724879 RepID=UPI001EF35C87|nr:questin oxidase family protein [Vibrio sp. Of7-15]MCG7497632.1 questin oxidase family protein [Vibrio sp. Of7-15]
MERASIIKSQKLIKLGHQFDPIYDTDLSNHLPMALSALELCGATQEQIEHFYRFYTPRLEKMRADNTDHRQPATLGEPDHFHVHRKAIRTQLINLGIEKTLKRQLPALLPGLSSNAFHCLIRLSYAVQAQEIDEIAIALAEWSSVNQTLGPLTTTQTYNAEQQLEQAKSQFGEKKLEFSNISKRVIHIINHDKFQAIRPIPENLSIETVAKVVVTQFLHTNDFTLLHGVTAFQAFLLLCPYFDDQHQALHYFWQAYVAVYASASHTPVVPYTQQPSTPQWQTWFQQCLQSLDDHTIKLVYSCSYIYQFFPYPEYLAAVEMRLSKEPK